MRGQVAVIMGTRSLKVTGGPKPRIRPWIIAHGGRVMGDIAESRRLL